MFKKIHLIGAVLAAALAVCTMPAFAQSAPSFSCYPSALKGGTGGPMMAHLLEAGPVACWQCPNGKWVTIAGNPSTVLANIGGRLDTIKAANTSASSASAAVSASWKRHIQYDINVAPEYAAMREQLKAAKICGW